MTTPITHDLLPLAMITWSIWIVSTLSRRVWGSRTLYHPLIAGLGVPVHRHQAPSPHQLFPHPLARA
eukprot:800957-Rhodomonas_salina.1